MLQPLIAILLFAILAACGRLEARHPAPPASLPARAELQGAYDQRLKAFADATKGRSGWPSATDCDGTVWAGVACLAGADVDIGLAEYPAGTLNRRPGSACWVPGAPDPQASASTASDDDVVLYAACAFKKGDRAALERLLDQAAASGGWIGVPHIPDVDLLGTNLEGTIARAAMKLGADARPDAKDPVVELPPGKDYQVHIVTEEVDFAATVAGQAGGWELALLTGMAATNATDALVQAELGVYTGHFEVATGLLLEASTPIPSYVRGDQADLFAQAWWLRAARIVLDHTKE